MQLTLEIKLQENFIELQNDSAAQIRFKAAMMDKLRTFKAISSTLGKKRNYAIELHMDSIGSFFC